MKAPKRLKAWRVLAGLTQCDAAARAGVSQTAWNHWEAGKKKPDVDNAVELEKLTEGAVSVQDWADPRERPAPVAEDSSRRLAKTSAPRRKAAGQ